jgi:mono/diheme cytochrome c family protein
LSPSVADVLAVAGDSPAGSGEIAFRTECASCHADLEYPEIKEMLPTAEEILDDPVFIRELNGGMIYGTLAKLHEMGEFYAAADRTRMIDTHQTEYPQMPPLVGTDEDVEALAAYLVSLDALGGE